MFIGIINSDNLLIMLQDAMRSLRYYLPACLSIIYDHGIKKHFIQLQLNKVLYNLIAFKKFFLLLHLFVYRFNSR